MTLVIGIKSCQRDLAQGFHEAVRQTWGQIQTPVRFFVGNGQYENLQQDEIVIDAPDDYLSLPLKTKAMMVWFLKSDFDTMFLCDNDTFVSPKLLGLRYQDYDYAGKISLWPLGVTPGQTFRYDDGRGNILENCSAWASGGYGYFVSKKAAQIVVDTEISSWAEDLSVGQALGPHIRTGHIKAHDFSPYHGEITWHFQKNIKPFEVSDIYEAHKIGPTGRKWAAK